MMRFEIYTLGDTQMYWDVLNGIAMIFSGSDLVSGTNGMNLSFGAFVGAMILLCVMIYKSVFERQFDIRSLLLPLTIYMVLTVPKATVVVNDIYNVEPVKMIDNVPLGLALPASAFSGFSFLLTQLLEQSLTVIPLTNGVGYLPKMTEEGFLTPLQVLNQVRYDDMNRAYPAFQQTITSLYNECVINNPSFSAQQYQQSTNSFDYILRTAQNSSGMVVINKNFAGETQQVAVGCSEASDSIRTTYMAYIDGSADVFNMLNMSIQKNSFQDRLNKRLTTVNTYGKIKTVNGYNHYTPNQITDMVGNTIGITGDRARNFISSVTFDPLVKTAASCVEKFDSFNLSMCTGWISANEQWKQSAAMSGTSFIKNLKNGQNLLVLVGFLLFPIMVFMIMLKGMGSAKLIGGYICFMMSNFLWLPFATIINFYAQMQFQEAAYLLMSQDPDASLTLSQAPQLYDALSQKIAVASNALGMVPVLTTMLFGGMMWGMSAVANSMNPAEAGYNTKLNSKTIKDSAPLSSSSSVLNRDGYGGTTIQGVGNVSMKLENARSAAETQTRTITARQEQILSRMEAIADKGSNSISQGGSTASGHKHSDSSGELTVHSKGGGESKGFTVSDTKDTGKNTVEDEKTQNVQLSRTSKTEYSGAIDGSVSGNLALGGSMKGLIKDSKVGAEASVGAKVEARTSATNVLNVGESRVGENTPNETEKRSSSSQDNLRIGNSTATTNNGKEATYSVSASSDYDYAASRLNEKIQNSRTGAISASEQKEAKSLLEEMQTLSKHKQQIYSSVLSNSVSDRDLAGMMNDLSPRSQQVKDGLDNLDRLGRDQVERWDELKNMGERNARLGGHHDQQMIERLGVFFAATHSNNSDVTVAAINAVSSVGLSSRFHENSSMYSRLEGNYERITNANEQIANNGLTGREVNALDKAMNTDLSPERKAAIASAALGATAAAVGLSEKELKQAENNVVVDYKDVHYDAEKKRIYGEFKTAQNIAINSTLPKIVDENGIPKKPEIQAPIDDKILKTTQIDDDLKDASKRGDRNAVVDILTKENEVLTGVDARNQAEIIKAAALESVPQGLRPQNLDNKSDKAD